MKLNKLYIFLAVILTSMSMTACFDDQGADAIFDGGFVEFEDGRLPNGRTASFVRLNDDQIDVVDLQLNRVSTVSSNPINVNIEVDPSSTAIAGVHYTFEATSTTISANEFVETIPITVLTGNIDPSESPNLVLNITSADGAQVSTNYGSVTLAIRVICQSELEGTYSVFYETLKIGDGTGGADQTLTNYSLDDEVNFEVSGTGAYLVDDISFGIFPGMYGDAAPSGTVYDVCSVITGEPSNTDQYGDSYTINGIVNEDGTISITWVNTWGDGGDVVLTKK
ncbi:hypothetical protein [Algoriphagus sp. Y33]|uniref:hypothetical protein n=1 Tax=Algoriphagus sp. Y33 TaxID=2772483 RepID=UPI001780D239|nr:hypothetical protein [Algoriphagus sp. Y33]